MNANRLPSGPQSLLLNRASDYTGEWGARMLVNKIVAFWGALGKYPNVWAERQEVPAVSTESAPLWVVRSDMVGGRPL